MSDNGLESPADPPDLTPTLNPAGPAQGPETQTQNPFPKISDDMADENTSPQYSIPMLTSDNYPLWSEKKEMHLQSRGLWGYVNGSIACPTDEAGSAAWKTNDNRARADIGLSLGDKIFKVVKSKGKTSKEYWEAIAINVREKTGIQSISELARLFNAGFHSGDDLEEYIQEKTEIAETLRLSKFYVHEGLVASIILSQLLNIDEWKITANLAAASSKWKPSSVMINGDTIETRTLDDEKVRNILIAEHRRRKQKDLDSTIAGASRRPPWNAKSHCKPNPRDRCYNCGENGHLRYDFPKEKKKDEKKLDGKGKGKGNGRNGKKPEGPGAGSVGGQGGVYGVMVNLGEKVLQAAPLPKEVWLVDSGAGIHLTPHREILSDFTESFLTVTTANGAGDLLRGFGKVQIGGHTITEVWYWPKAVCNLLSCHVLSRKGIEWSFTDSECLAKDKGTVILRGESTRDGWTVSSPDGSKIAAFTHSIDLELCHCQLGHLNFDAIKRMAKENVANDLWLKNTKNISKPCPPCAKGKMRKKSVPKEAEHRAVEVLELVHVDIVSPIPPSSAGHRYAFIVTDNMSRRLSGAAVRSAVEAISFFRNWVIMAERQTGKQLKRVQMDGAKYFTKGEMEKWLVKEGVMKEISAPYLQSQNGVAERANGTIMDMTRAMLIGAGADTKLWNYAFDTALYIKQRVPQAAINGRSPYELWYGKKPKVSHMRVWGCTAYVFLAKDQRDRGKFAPKAVEGKFVGYAPNHEAYLFLVKGKERVAWQADFAEAEGILSGPGKVPGPPTVTSGHQDVGTGKIPPSTEISAPQSESSDSEVENDLLPDLPKRSRRERDKPDPNNIIEGPRSRRPPNRYGEDVVQTKIINSSAVIVFQAIQAAEPRSAREALTRVFDDAKTLEVRVPLEPEPVTLEEARRSDEWEQWEAAMRAEVNGLLAPPPTWIVVPRPKGGKDSSLKQA